MTKPAVAGSLLLLAALGVAVAGERQPVYKTPQEVFEAARKALQREDIKGFCAILTDNSRDTLAGGFVLMYGLMKAFSMRESEEKQWEFMAKFKPLDDVFAKHGLMEKAPNKTKNAKPAGDSPEAFAQVLKELVAPVKDRGLFIADVVDCFNKLDEKKIQNQSVRLDVRSPRRVEGVKDRGVYGQGGRNQKRGRAGEARRDLV
jgi:hypothetical protein